MYIGDKWDYIREIAIARLEKHYRHKSNLRLQPYIEVVGAAGELAARRFLGLPEVLKTELDGGTDFILAGHTVDVKSTLWKHNVDHQALQWRADRVPAAELLMLVMVHTVDREAIVAGFATTAEILRAKVNYRRPLPCHELPFDSLHNPSRLYRLRELSAEVVSADSKLDPLELGLGQKERSLDERLAEINDNLIHYHGGSGP